MRVALDDQLDMVVAGGGRVGPAGVWRDWPGAGFVDTEIGCFMKPEMADATTEVWARTRFPALYIDPCSISADEMTGSSLASKMPPSL